MAVVEVPRYALPICPRCGLGIDDDGDGDCNVCASLRDDAAERIRQAVMARKREGSL